MSQYIEELMEKEKAKYNAKMNLLNKAKKVLEEAGITGNHGGIANLVLRILKKNLIPENRLVELLREHGTNFVSYWAGWHVVAKVLKQDNPLEYIIKGESLPVDSKIISLISLYNRGKIEDLVIYIAKNKSAEENLIEFMKIEDVIESFREDMGKIIETAREIREKVREYERRIGKNIFYSTWMKAVMSCAEWWRGILPEIKYTIEKALEIGIPEFYLWIRTVVPKQKIPELIRYTFKYTREEVANRRINVEAIKEIYRGLVRVFGEDARIYVKWAIKTSFRGDWRDIKEALWRARDVFGKEAERFIRNAIEYGYDIPTIVDAGEALKSIGIEIDYYPIGRLLEEYKRYQEIVELGIDPSEEYAKDYITTGFRKYKDFAIYVRGNGQYVAVKNPEGYFELR